MVNPRNFLRPLLTTGFSLVLAATVVAQEAPVTEPGQLVPEVPQVENSNLATADKSAEPILTFYQVSGLIPEEGEPPSPYVSVYGDGKVVVVVPTAFVNPGTYEYQLTDKELDSLIDSLSTKGLFSVDSDELKKELKRVSASKADSGPVNTSACPTLSVVEFSVATKSGDEDRKVMFVDLQTNADIYSASKSLSNLAAAERELISLRNDDRKEQVSEDTTVAEAAQ